MVKELLSKEIDGSGAGSVVVQEIERETGDGRRYILCLNKERRKEETQRLEETRKDCEEKLKQLAERFHDSQTEAGKGRPLTREGVARQVKRILASHSKLFNVDVGDSLEWELDQDTWRYEKAIAGKFLLVTTTSLDPWQVMVAYKNLQDVERAFNELKNLLRLRPIYHRLDKRVKGHVTICHLALLTKRLITQGSHSNQRLDRLRQIKTHQLDLNGNTVWVRNQLTQHQATIFNKLGLPPPQKIVQEPRQPSQPA